MSDFWSLILFMWACFGGAMILFGIIGLITNNETEGPLAESDYRNRLECYRIALAGLLLPLTVILLVFYGVVALIKVVWHDLALGERFSNWTGGK